VAGHERLLLAVRNAAAALLATLAGIYLARLLWPFLLGLVAAIILDPLVSAGARRGLPRGVAAVILLLVVTLGTLGLVALGVTRLAGEVGALIESGWGEEGLRRLESTWGGLQNLLKGEPARQGLGAVAGWGLAAARAVPGAAVATVISLLAAYLLLKDKDRLLAAAVRLLPRSVRATGAATGEEVARGLAGVIRAELLLSVATGALAVVAFSALGIRYAWLLGLTAGLLDLVPMVGSSGVFLPTAVYLAVTGAPGKALGVLAVAGVGMLVRQVLEPRLLAAGTGLHPLTMLLAVYAGFRLFGPFGLVAGPLAAAFFAALFHVAVSPLLDEA
jgi:predicted PurR-regulated permease PerM